MYKLGELAFAVGLAIMSAAFPALAQQPQQQMPMQQGQQIPMMGHGMMMGGQPGMMGGQQGMMGGQQGMMGSGMPGMMGGCPMMGGMMGGSGMPMMGSGMQGMMGQGMPMMGTGMGMGCPWCGPGMMGSGYATPQVSLNLSAADVKSYLERWTAGNPNIKVANVVEQDTNTITADIVTSDKGGLVQRYTFDRQNGFYHPVQ
jgi:hypothetical protein